VIQDDGFSELKKGGWSFGDYISNSLSPFAPINSAPPIISFTANPISGASGAPVLLSWSVPFGAISIDNGVGVVANNGSVIVNPTVTTTWTLTATSLRGKQSQAQATYTVAGANDPFWASVILLLNGADLLDATGRHTFTVVQDPDGSVTGTPSGLHFVKPAALRTVTNLSDFAFAGSWTMDFQTNGETIGASTALILSAYNTDSAGEWEVFTRGSPNFNMGFYAPGGAFVEPTTPAVITNTPIDWAITYDLPSNTLRTYVNGVKNGEIVGGPNNYLSTAPALFVGRETATSGKSYAGYLRLRVTLANRNYGNSYTPPTWPAPTS
jgi:hypothetical protein